MCQRVHNFIRHFSQFPDCSIADRKDDFDIRLHALEEHFSSSSVTFNPVIFASRQIGLMSPKLQALSKRFNPLCADTSNREMRRVLTTSFFLSTGGVITKLKTWQMTNRSIFVRYGRIWCDRERRWKGKYASAYANHIVGSFFQNSGSLTATLAALSLFTAITGFHPFSPGNVG